MKKNIIRGVVFFFLCVMVMNAQAQSQKRVEKTVEKRSEQLEKDK